MVSKSKGAPAFGRGWGKTAEWLALAAGAAFLLLSIGSFFVHWSADQNFLEHYTTADKGTSILSATLTGLFAV